jgi:glucuronoarabinoxylan endo-1,4-beta-xylanase
LVSAYKNPNTGEFAIVVVNKDALTKTFTLDGFTATSVTPWVTSDSLNLAQRPAIAVSDGGFTATLAASSVTTFVGKAGTTTDPPPPPPPAPPTGLRIIR